MAHGRDPITRREAGARDLASTGERDARIAVVDYDPSWPARFSAEAARLAEILPTLQLHHIGSTAVSGLAAKPTIDMMSLVEDLEAVVPVLVSRAGYQHPDAYNATLLRRRWLCHPSASLRSRHLHLVADGRELDRHLRFRDALRDDPQLAAGYAALKRELAQRMPDDREGYTAAKAAFIERVEAAF